ncbi:gliding motility-associated peptidyl-prolyl isomerase GldI [Flavobacterium seoulense]|uniref:Peptidyl-prolyl cis-trans isomerase n=1 Tax=Flavobacterium seoulense TaxID=1492738 RepID=A0A066WTT6_9FLAO|nr:gliding motility-associated peptidyl-prolyl isomerase GldI [Flavobacterium seoulense]KDN55993.1 gldI [Flavobacterium seoulense]
MKTIRFILISGLLCFLFTSCVQHQEARRPVSNTSGVFMKKSVERNKKLNASDEDLIKALMKKNPKISYFASPKGYWYSYEIKNDIDTLTPKKGDVAFFNYELKDLNGNTIYSEVELRSQVYRVDKQEIMTGIRDGIKLMRKNERVNFYFPSHIAYGYHGDNKKIGPNQPLICTITLNDFKPESVYKKELELNRTTVQDSVKKTKRVLSKPKTTTQDTLEQ